MAKRSPLLDLTLLDALAPELRADIVAFVADQMGGAAPAPGGALEALDCDYETASRRATRRRQQARQRAAAKPYDPAAERARRAARTLRREAEAMAERMRASPDLYRVILGRDDVEPWMPDGRPSPAMRALAELGADFEAELVQRVVAERRDRADEAAARLDTGFVWRGGAVGGNPAYQRKAFTAPGLKSERHPLLRLFVSKTARATGKADGLRVGDDKGAVWPVRSKLLGLDRAYVEFQGKMVGAIREDLDRVFASADELRVLIGAAGVPEPNLVVGFVDDAGRLWNPHCYWLIHDSVAFSGDGRRRAQSLYHRVSTALTGALAHLGADVGGKVNARKGKNPLSFLWDTFVWAQDPYTLNGAEEHPDLPALVPALDLRVRRSRLARAAARAVADEVAVAGGGKVASNDFFSQVRAHAARLVHQFQATDDFDGFHNAVLEWALGSTRGNIDRAGAIAEKVIDHLWMTYDEAKAPRVARGRDEDLTVGLGAAEARAVAGRRTAADRRAASEDAVRRAVAALRREGVKPTQKAVSARAGLALRTVKALWRKAFGESADSEKVQDGGIVKEAASSRQVARPRVAASSHGGGGVSTEEAAAVVPHHHKPPPPPPGANAGPTTPALPIAAPRAAPVDPTASSGAAPGRRQPPGHGEGGKPRPCAAAQLTERLNQSQPERPRQAEPARPSEAEPVGFGGASPRAETAVVIVPPGFPRRQSAPASVSGPARRPRADAVLHPGPLWAAPVGRRTP